MAMSEERKRLEEEELLRQAAEQKTQQQNSGYNSKYQAAIDTTMETIANRKPFTYDAAGDALYQQYKDRYINQGKQAMKDAIGMSAMMTGGYGNSYAQTVGQQTYQQYLGGLNDRIPELYTLAQQRYQNQHANDMDKLNALMAADEREYGRYLDSIAPTGGSGGGSGSRDAAQPAAVAPTYKELQPYVDDLINSGLSATQIRNRLSNQGIRASDLSLLVAYADRMLKKRDTGNTTTANKATVNPVKATKNTRQTK